MIATDLETTLRASLGAPPTASSLARLDARLRDRLSAPGRRLTGRRRVIVLATATVLLIPAAVGVSAGIRYTESPRGLESAAAYQAEIDAAKRVVPLPAGARWPWWVNVQNQSGDYATGGGRSQVEGAAFCLWLGDWIAARQSGDSARQSADRATLLQVPTWEMYTGEFADTSYREVIAGVLVGVRSNDPAPGQAFSSANCTVP